MSYGYEEALARRAAGTTLSSAGGSGYFAQRGQTLDPALFERLDHLRPDVRRWLLSVVYGFWESRGLRGFDQWSQLWLAGSGITTAWDADREADGAPGDLDTLMGIDYAKMAAMNPAFAGSTPHDIAKWMNQQMFDELWPAVARTHIGVGSYPWVDDEQALKRVTSGHAATRKGSPSPRSGGSSASAHTPSGSPSSRVMSHYAVTDAGSTPPVGGVANHQSTAGSARSASPSTSGSSTSSGSSGSRSESSTDFYARKMGDAGSAGQPSPVARTASGTSIMNTRQAEYADFSATSATTGSASSGTASRVSSGHSTTSRASLYEVTVYINDGVGTGAYDLRVIEPYAAYNLNVDKWIVHPVDVSADFSDSYFSDFDRNVVAGDQADITRAHEVYGLALAAYNVAGNVGVKRNTLTSLHDAVRAGAAVYDRIHNGRRAAFSPGGRGYFDPANYRWQAGKGNGTVTLARGFKQLDEASHRDLAAPCSNYGHLLLLASLANGGR